MAYKYTDEIKKTNNAYGFLWKKVGNGIIPKRWHFNDMQEVVPEPIVRDKIGIDIGSGCGYDTYIMARTNPLVQIISLDISDGIYKTRELSRDLKNVRCVKGSVLKIPVRNDTFDFAYSFGVLHHIPYPEKGIEEIARILKNGAYVHLYLYENHSENYAKYLAIKIVRIFRKVTVRMPPKALYIISYLISPLVVVMFSYPAKIFRKFKTTKNKADRMPFNFGTHLFSLAGDLYDRFSVPIEHRFSKKEIFDLLNNSNFINIKIGRLRSKAGWVAWGQVEKKIDA